jgi:hypothetical protein
MIEVHVLAVVPHPDQATNNPGDWAVRFEISYKGATKTFWRWHTVKAFNENGRYITSPPIAPSHDQILHYFWDDTFHELNGFARGEETPFSDGAWP